jgi:hypothetical protein
MGATVTTDRRVGAFTAPAGNIVYVVFDRTYEKNCTPHTPEWCCIGIGGIKDVIRRFFLYGADCEGGALQNPSGHITPEGYIRSWLGEIEAPFEMPDFEVTLRVGTSMYSTIGADKMPKVSAALATLGRADIVTTLLAGGSFTLSFQKDAEVVMALYGLRGKNKSLLSPWLVVDSCRTPSKEMDRNARLGYFPKPVRSDPAASADPVVYRVGEDDCFVVKPDGSLKPAGWPYILVGHFIQDFWEEEMRAPRSFGRRIKAFREMVKNAPKLSTDELIVTIDTTAPVEEAYQSRSIAMFQGKYPESVYGNIFDLQPTKDNFYQIQQLPDVCVTWKIKSGQAIMAAQPETQVSLF